MASTARPPDAVPGALHPDRLLPAEPGVRAVARQLYDAVAGAPIISPHGHVDPDLLLHNTAFGDAATLFVTPDHYVTRLLHAQGVPMRDLAPGATELSEDAARRVWRLLCRHWRAFAGTPVRYWLQHEFVELFGLPATLDERTADDTFDRIADRLASPEFRPRRLFERFGIEILATTDDPCDGLLTHDTLNNDPDFPGRLVPTFRPDAYLEPGPDWVRRMSRLADAAGVDTAHYEGYLSALRGRRSHFIAHGAASTDHGHIDVDTQPLSADDAGLIYRDALAGTVSAPAARAFRANMLFEMARMSCDDGLVMTVHPGVCRDHHGPTLRDHGPDTGHDIPVATEFTRSLRPLLDAFGTASGFHLVLFTVDETTFSREISPLAGFYPSVYIGAPWWFLDAPDAIQRARAATVETAGFTRLTGFIDDTRAFCSIPARHDMSRRLDAAYLARLVAEHRLDETEAIDIARQLVDALPRRAFKLGQGS